MNKLVGIRGHRGAGKESVAYLLANTLQYIDGEEELEINTSDPERFTQAYTRWVEKLVNDKNKALANKVFPVPGGPYNNTPFQGRLNPIKKSGISKGRKRYE